MVLMVSIFQSFAMSLQELYKLLAFIMSGYGVWIVFKQPLWMLGGCVCM